MSFPQRLPYVNGDDGQWGDIIVQWLKKEHYDDGTDNAVNGGHKTVTIRAGTASAGTAPLKLTSGTLLSSPEAGAVEFLTDNLYFTITTGAVRKTIAMYDDSSGATGDIYYRNSSGVFSRLPIGSTNNILAVSGGLPAWTGALSLTGASGATGPAGRDAGIKFTYSNDTASSDPTSGKIKFDSTTLSSITAMRISETDGDSNGIATLIQTWDDSTTSAARTTITMVKDGSPGNVLILQVTGAITDNGTWDSCSVSYVGSSGSFANNDVVKIFYSRTGDTGATGPQGATGPIANLSVSTKSTTYTITGSDDIILANANSAGFTVTLPTAVGVTKYYTIKKTDSSANIVTIGTTSSQTIDGGTTAQLKVQYASITVASDNSNWNIV